MDKTRITHTAFRSPSGCYMLADHMGMTRNEVEAVLLNYYLNKMAPPSGVAAYLLMAAAVLLGAAVVCAITVLVVALAGIGGL